MSKQPCPDEKNKQGKKRRAELVDELLSSIEAKLKGTEAKASLTDYIRLLQLQKELDEETPNEIRVKWVDSEESSES